MSTKAILSESESVNDSPVRQRFQSTSPKVGGLDAEQESECLRLAFAILGQLIADRAIEVDFNCLDWEASLKIQAEIIAETIYNYRH